MMEYVVVIDFEATCDVGQRIGQHVNQIIEFGAALVNVQTQQIESTFHKYCQPSGTLRILSQYCMNLTGVTQANVDSALQFPDVLRSFEEWLQQHRLLPNPDSSVSYLSIRPVTSRWILASDSMYDYTVYLYNECKLNNIPYPSYAQRILTIGSLFKNNYLNVPARTRMPNGMARMLEHMGMDFEGRRHSALDDAWNLARIVVRMVQDGHRYSLRATIKVLPDHQQYSNHRMPNSCGYIDMLEQEMEDELDRMFSHRFC